MASEELSNKRILLKSYVTGFPSEDDMILTSATVPAKLPPGSTALLLKNLFLSCDPYMRSRMSKPVATSYRASYEPGSVPFASPSRPFPCLSSKFPPFGCFSVVFVLIILFFFF